MEVFYVMAGAAGLVGSFVPIFKNRDYRIKGHNYPCCTGNKHHRFIHFLLQRITFLRKGKLNRIFKE